jgi:hypothetical protein
MGNAWLAGLLTAALTVTAGAEERAEPLKEEAHVDAPEERPAPETPPKPSLDLHGAALLWYYQPFLEGADNHFDIFFAQVTTDWHMGDFGLFVNPRFRNTRFRSFFDSNIWVQEAYAYWKGPRVTLKAGKVNSRFGRFWDGSFYGQLPYFDGLKLSPEHGLSAEETVPITESLEVEYAAQFFAVDGQTNGSLNRGHPDDGPDTLFTPGARKRNMMVARLAPVYEVGKLIAQLGLSGQRFEVDWPVGMKDGMVNRFGVDLTAAYGPASVFGEYSVQDGKHVLSHPLSGLASEETHTLWAGAQFDIWKLALRYTMSRADYRDLRVTELIHQPGIVFAIHPNLSLYLEYVLWTRDINGLATPLMDRSLNALLDAHF